jgi:predicted  nucleic acid-binding Zn-ribbon protein
MTELSLAAMQSLRSDAQRRLNKKQAELDAIPSGVRSSAYSTDQAFLQMDIQKLNQMIAEYDEIISARTDQIEKGNDDVQ